MEMGLRVLLKNGDLTGVRSAPVSPTPTWLLGSSLCWAWGCLLSPQKNSESSFILGGTRCPQNSLPVSGIKTAAVLTPRGTTPGIISEAGTPTQSLLAQSSPPHPQQLETTPQTIQRHSACPGKFPRKGLTIHVVVLGMTVREGVIISIILKP